METTARFEPNGSGTLRSHRCTKLSWEHQSQAIGYGWLGHFLGQNLRLKYRLSIFSWGYQHVSTSFNIHYQHPAIWAAPVHHGAPQRIDRWFRLQVPCARLPDPSDSAELSNLRPEGVHQACDEWEGQRKLRPFRQDRQVLKQHVETLQQCYPLVN